MKTLVLKHMALIVLVVVIAIVTLVLSLASRANCAIYGYQAERETKYAAFVGCMVKVDGKWYPRNELRIQQ